MLYSTLYYAKRALIFLRHKKSELSGFNRLKRHLLTRVMKNFWKILFETLYYMQRQELEL